jgi:cell division protease FtsH
VDFLKTPERFARLGGRIPKGILLAGPPGTGKTLLARAVAGEAGVPFFSISGSEFVEMFVGVGAARVRDLFVQARTKAPCIVFIDELDALGKVRGAGPMAHEEREQTLNQLLVELDGFDPRLGVILMAATNRPEILDPALLRAGRFDRHVLVDRPDKAGRLAILALHARSIALAPGADLETIASMTAGFVGADLANIINEAALLAVRRGRESVGSSELQEAVERVIAGLERRNRVLTPADKQRVARHEVGHALVSYALPGVDVVQKISIIPRGIAALGYTLQLPTEDRFLMTQGELQNKIATLLGGRVAEELCYGEVSTGAQDDLVKATNIARSMVKAYGMSREFGPVSFDSERSPFLAVAPGGEPRGDYSESTAQRIDGEVRRILEAEHERVRTILSARRPALEAAALELLSREVLSGDELRAIVDRHALTAAAG